MYEWVYELLRILNTGAIILILCSILSINSCDIVEGPYITDADSYVNPDKKVLIEDISYKFDQSIILNGDDCITLLDGDETFDIIYTSICENLSFINLYKRSDKTNFVYNESNLACWKFSKKGFFNFKKNIPDIIKKLNSNGELFT